MLPSLKDQAAHRPVLPHMAVDHVLTCIRIGGGKWHSKLGLLADALRLCW